MMRYRTIGPEETGEIGFRMGRLLEAGDTVGLYGELGSGKTTMAKGIARALGIAERDIVSASFTIMTEYNVAPRFIHIDLYRVNSEEEVQELGLQDVVGGRNISVVEWAEKASGLLPDDMIKITLKILDENEREITVEGLNEKDRNCR